MDIQALLRLRPDDPFYEVVNRVLQIDDPAFQGADWRIEKSLLTTGRASNGALRVLHLSGAELPAARENAWGQAQRSVEDFCLLFSWVAQAPMFWRLEKFRLDRMGPPRFWVNEPIFLNDFAKQTLDAVARGRVLSPELRFSLRIYRAALGLPRRESFALLYTILEVNLPEPEDDPQVVAALEAIGPALNQWCATQEPATRERVTGIFARQKKESITTRMVRFLTARGFAPNEAAARLVPRFRGQITHAGEAALQHPDFATAEGILYSAVERLIEDVLVAELGIAAPPAPTGQAPTDGP